MVDHTRRIFKGRVVTLDIDTVTLPNGATIELEMIHHPGAAAVVDRKSTRLNSSPSQISYADFCLKKKRAGKRAAAGRLGDTEGPVEVEGTSVRPGLPAGHGRRVITQRLAPGGSRPTARGRPLVSS